MGVKQKGKNWFIDYYCQGKRIREKVSTSKSLAVAVLNKRKLQIAENRHLDVKKTSRVKFEELAGSYLELYAKPNKKSWERDKHSLKHLSRFFGGRLLCGISSFDIEKYKQKRLEENSSFATVNRELACLKHMFTKAIEWRMADASPASRVKLFRENNKRVRYLSEEETRRFVEACPAFLKPMVVLALNTGMRRGEIFNLKWENVDLEQKFIRVEEAKSGEKREIPLNTAVLRLLEGLPRPPGCEYVFHKGNGQPYRDVRESFKKACRKAEIEDFRFHDLRHTFASHLVMKGADLKTVQELLGHKTYEMTLRYAHLSPDYKGRIVERIHLGMDTFWTPSAFSDTMGNLENPLNLDFTDEDCKTAGVAKLADALDSKSSGTQIP